MKTGKGEGVRGGVGAEPRERTALSSPPNGAVFHLGDPGPESGLGVRCEVWDGIPSARPKALSCEGKKKQSGDAAPPRAFPREKGKKKMLGKSKWS